MPRYILRERDHSSAGWPHGQKLIWFSIKCVQWSFLSPGKNIYTTRTICGAPSKLKREKKPLKRPRTNKGTFFFTLADFSFHPLKEAFCWNYVFEYKKYYRNLTSTSERAKTLTHSSTPMKLDKEIVFNFVKEPSSEKNLSSWNPRKEHFVWAQFFFQLIQAAESLMLWLGCSVLETGPNFFVGFF